MDAKAPAWPADKVERRAVSSLKPYAKNSRTHSEAQIEQIARSITEFGFTVPVLIDPKGEIIAGHGRVLAAESLGLDDVPVMVAKGWSAAQKRAYVIADNKLALNAGWDEALLSAELKALGEDGFDLALTGFDDAEIGAFDLPGGGNGDAGKANGSLAEKFGIPPFSVLNAREGWWQDRKAAWLALGIVSELGRGENLLRFSDTINQPDPKKRAAAKKAAGQTEDLRGGLTHRTTTDPYRAKSASAVPGNHGRPSSPSHRDPAFYAKKREWEKANGRQISTAEFREKHWNGGA